MKGALLVAGGSCLPLEAQEDVQPDSPTPTPAWRFHRPQRKRACICYYKVHPSTDKSPKSRMWTLPKASLKCAPGRLEWSMTDKVSITPPIPKLRAQGAGKFV
jgi:hypothetical protein